MSVSHGTITLLKQDLYASGDADNACGNLDDLVEQIQFLNQASGMYNFTLHAEHRTSSVIVVIQYVLFIHAFVFYFLFIYLIILPGGPKNGLRSATNQPPSRGSSNNPELG